MVTYSFERELEDQTSCSCFYLVLHSGLIPRLLGDVLSLWICNMLAHLINTYAIDDSVRELLSCAVKGVLGSVCVEYRSLCHASTLTW